MHKNTFLEFQFSHAAFSRTDISWPSAGVLSRAEITSELEAVKKENTLLYSALNALFMTP